ncbi:MAG: glycosyltransferase [Acidobacteria bacterium]|nr:glycosyltransferase [Acidobacteriota bacterium]
MLSRLHLSVVIPAYNEEARLPASLERIDEYLREHRIEGEILVIDDGSTDRTSTVAGELLKDRRGRVIGLAENRGKGAAVRRGVAEAAGRWVLMTDADLSAPIEEHQKLAATARDDDVDLVIASRGLEDSRIEVRQAWVRQTMGKTFNVLMRAMTGLPFRDTQCGFKLMDRQRVLPLFEKMVVDRFAFDVELLYLAVRFGLAVREIPVVWRNEPHSRVNMITDPINMLRDVARIRWRFRRGAYNPDK